LCVFVEEMLGNETISWNFTSISFS